MDILFNCCDAVVYIRMIGITNKDLITSYAKNLDERLKPLMCRLLKKEILGHTLF